MSNVINIGWPYLMMRDGAVGNPGDDSVKHLPFEEVNQLLLAALSSGEHSGTSYMDNPYSRYSTQPVTDSQDPVPNMYHMPQSQMQQSQPQQQPQQPQIQPQRPPIQQQTSNQMHQIPPVQMQSRGAPLLSAQLYQHLQQQRQTQQEQPQAAQIKPQTQQTQQNQQNAPLAQPVAKPAPQPQPALRTPSPERQSVSPPRNSYANLPPPHVMNQPSSQHYGSLPSQLHSGYQSSNLLHSNLSPAQQLMMPSHMSSSLSQLSGSNSHAATMQQLHSQQMQQQQHLQQMQQQQLFMQSLQAHSSPTTLSPQSSSPPQDFSPTNSGPPSPPSPTTVYQFINVKDEQDPLKTKPLTEKQKSRRRASQNLASRNYRQRKKEYINTMEEKMQALAEENERLRREVNESKHLASKLVKENTTLKTGASAREEDDDEELTDSRLDADIKDLIVKLESGIKLEADAEEELAPVLNDFYETLRAKHDNFTNQVKEIVNPCTQAKISLIDSEPATPLDNGMSENDDRWWEQFEKDAEITPEQSSMIKEVRRGHYIEFHRLRNERRELNTEVRKFYKGKMHPLSSQMVGGSNNQAELPELVELGERLEALKANLDAEKALILATHEAMSKILSSKQEAMLVTRSYRKVHQANTHTLEMLDNMWEVISRKESLLEKCCGPDSWRWAGGL